MKADLPPFVRLTIMVALPFLMASCVSAPHHRAAVRDDTVDRLTVGVVQKGIRVGMTGAEVIALLGSPNIVTTDEERREVWTYDKVSTETVTSSGSVGLLRNRGLPPPHPPARCPRDCGPHACSRPAERRCRHRPERGAYPFFREGRHDGDAAPAGAHVRHPSPGDALGHRVSAVRSGHALRSPSGWQRLSRGSTTTRIPRSRKPSARNCIGRLPLLAKTIPPRADESIRKARPVFARGNHGRRGSHGVRLFTLHL